MHGGQRSSFGRGSTERESSCGLSQLRWPSLVTAVMSSVAMQLVCSMASAALCAAPGSLQNLARPTF